MGDARVFDWPGVAARIFLPPGPLSGRRGPASREIYFAGQMQIEIKQRRQEGDFVRLEDAHELWEP